MRFDFKPYGSAMLERSQPNFQADRDEEFRRRDMDDAFQALLMDAWNRGEFPGQSFKLVAE